MRHHQMISVLVLSALPFLSTPVMADIVSPCLDGNTATCIVETPINNGVGYSITNNLVDTRLFAFAVTNPEFNGYSYSDHLGWKGQYVASKAWDDGRYQFYFYETAAVNLDTMPTMIWVSGTQTQYGNIGQEKVAYTALGSYASLFGTEENQASFFWNSGLNQNPLNNGVTLALNYMKGGSPYSEFSTFGEQGNVVTTSVSAVPEPETYAMFLAGLGLLGLMRRKA